MCGHESWVMIESAATNMSAELRFLRKIKGAIRCMTKFLKLRFDIRESPNIESLFLLIQKSQLRWFDYAFVSRMPQERLPKQTSHAKVNGKRLVGRPLTR